MAESEIKIIMPEVALGANVVADRIDCMLRTLSVLCGEKDEWPSKYGANFDNDVFMLHKFCWCEEDDCPWCGECSCEMEYHLVGNKVSLSEYYDERNKNKKREAKLIRQCGYCDGTKQRNSHFYHKEADFKVWWYKYIGRGMEYQLSNGPIERDDPGKILTLGQALEMEMDCLRSIGVIK